jgi:cell division control protein 6
MSVFRDKKYLDINFVPSEDILMHRNKEKELLKIVFNNFSTSQNNMVCVGYAGTGKTCMVKHLTEEFNKTKITNDKIVYINIAKANTEFKALGEITYQLSIPMRSRMMSDHYRAIDEFRNSFRAKLLIILDEFDKLFENDNDNLIYNLLDSGISLIMITNNVMVFNSIEDRTKSRLGTNKLIFQPYNAIQIFEILQKRAELTFSDEIKNDVAILNGILSRISAISAQEDGDARKSILLLLKIAQIAEENNTGLKQEYVEQAIELSEEDIIKETINNLPTQVKISLLSLVDVWEETGKIDISLSEIYEKYLKNCEYERIKPVTQRRTSDFFWDIENTGIVSCKLLPKFRSREKIVRFGTPPYIIKKIIYKEYGNPQERENEKRNKGREI